MTYKVILSQTAEKELGLLDLVTRNRIIMKLDSIKERPLDYGDIFPPVNGVGFLCVMDSITLA